jgi:colanic acid biosynthesis glycosyl transferase WcaI
VRIAFISAIFPPEPEPSSVMAGELVQMWTKVGHEVTVVCPLPNRPNGSRYPGFPFRLWTIRAFEGARTIRVWSWLIGKRRRALARILENITFGVNSALVLLFIRRPHVVVLESWPVLATAAVMVVCAARGIKVINYVKDIYPEAAVAAGILRETGAAAVLLRVDRWICRRADCNVVISDGAAALLARSRHVPPARIRVICDWLDLRSIAPTGGGPAWRSANGIPHHEIVFMFAGTMGYVSRVDILVDVAEKLRAQDRVRLLCVGQGPLKPGMEEEVRRRRLTNLTLLPFQPRQDLADMQSAADVMLLTTSAKIGFASVPSKLITYLAVGKPVICAVPEGTDVSALVRDRQLGLVVSAENAEALADAIVHMSSIEPSARAAIGRRARAVALERYSLESALARFDTLFVDMGLVPGAVSTAASSSRSPVPGG